MPLRLTYPSPDVLGSVGKFANCETLSSSYQLQNFARLQIR